MDFIDRGLGCSRSSRNTDSSALKFSEWVWISKICFCGALYSVVTLKANNRKCISICFFFSVWSSLFIHGFGICGFNSLQVLEPTVEGILQLHLLDIFQRCSLMADRGGELMEMCTWYCSLLMVEQCTVTLVLRWLKRLSSKSRFPWFEYGLCHELTWWP